MEIDDSFRIEYLSCFPNIVFSSLGGWRSNTELNQEYPDLRSALDAEIRADMADPMRFQYWMTNSGSRSDYATIAKCEALAQRMGIDL